MKQQPTISLLFLSIFILQPVPSSSNSPTPKLLQFMTKLQQKTSIHTIVEPPKPCSSNSNAKNRVFYPIDYGADPTGVTDSSDAILKALEDAFKVGNGGEELIVGIKNLGVVLDLQGGSYKIGKPIRFPVSGVGNILVKEGTLRASDTFPGNRHLVELWSLKSKKFDISNNQAPANPSDSIYYEDVTFRNILFDSSFRGGGIFAIDTARIRINSCFFLHFTTQGVLIKNGHETFISETFLGQHSTVGGDPNERQFSGTAIDLRSNDNVVTDVVVFSASVGIVLRGQANMITDVHCYNKATGFGGVGIWIRVPGLSQTRIDNCYMDYTAIVMEDPVQVHISNGFFLGDANVVIRSIKGRISGLNIVDNMFSGSPKNKIPIVRLEGKFMNVDQVVIERNNVVGMELRSTKGKLTIAGDGTKWVADFSTVLLFSNVVNHFQYSLYYARGNGSSGFPTHAVTSVSDNVVVVESNRAVKGVVSVEVDQYSMVGEKSLFM